jgi:diguanylate cyclase (GGDEF)-like protein
VLLTPVFIALVAAVAALVIVVLVAGVASHSRSASEQRMTHAVEQLGSRIDGLAEELSGAIERAHEDGLRARALGDLGGTLDLEEALARTAEAACGLRGIDAAVVRVADLDGSMAVGVAGVAADEAARQAVTGPPDGRATRAVGLTYVYDEGDEPPGAFRSGVALPLEAAGEPLGLLVAYSHDPAPRLSVEMLARLEAITAAAGPLIDNARRFRQASATGEVDAVTGLPGRRSFLETLGREVARSHRFDRRLTVLVLDVDGLRSLNDRLGPRGGDDVLAAVAAAVTGEMRDSDLAFRVGGDELVAVLPESGGIDADALFARVRVRVDRDQPAVTLSGGIAELSADDDAVSLIDRAEKALARAKTTGPGSAAAS